MDDRLRTLVSSFELGTPEDAGPIAALAADRGIRLPDDYVAFLAETGGGAGTVGSAWIELWSVSEILETAASAEPRYEGVLLIASDGGNTVYGFDALASGRIVEGDWIGLNRDELIPRGQTLTELLDSLAGEYGT